MTTKYQPLNTYPEKVQRETMARLWSHMSAHFGDTWRRNFGEPGEPASNVWHDGLKDMTLQQIKRGLDGLKNWRSAFPPNLGEFRTLCLAHVPESQRSNFTEERLQKAGGLAGGIAAELERLGKRELTPIAKTEIEKMRRIAKGEEVETRQESYDKLHLAKRWGPL